MTRRGRPRTQRERDIEAARMRAKRLRSRLAPVALAAPFDRQNLLAPFGSEPTPREQEVLAEVMLHGDIGEAAYCLGIAIETAKQHLTHLYARLGAASGMQAVVGLGWAAWPRTLKVKRHLIQEPTVDPILAAEVR